jgi:hypothetical protein
MREEKGENKRRMKQNEKKKQKRLKERRNFPLRSKVIETEREPQTK